MTFWPTRVAPPAVPIELPPCLPPVETAARYQVTVGAMPWGVLLQSHRPEPPPRGGPTRWDCACNRAGDSGTKEGAQTRGW